MKTPAGISLLLCGVLALTPGISGAQQAPDAPDPGSDRLGQTLIRYARFVLQTDPLTIEGWNAATHLLQQATIVDPERASAWRMLADIAVAKDDTALLAQSVKAMVQLAPGDSAARLARLWVQLDQASTAEAQLNMIGRLLSGDHVEQLGRDVAADLALHAASLERQQGDVEAARHWQDQAVQLNPANWRAVAMDVGEHHADAVLWTAHLVALLKANPADEDTAVRLGIHLLEHGDAADAALFLNMARELSLAAGRDGGSSLDADLALAHLIAGDLGNARIVLDQRRSAMDEMFQTVTADDDRSAIETAALRAPLSPKIASAFIVAAVAAGEPVGEAIDNLVEGLAWFDFQEGELGKPASERSRPLRMGFRVAWAAGATDAQLTQVLQAIQSLELDTSLEEEMMAASRLRAEGRTDEARAALRTIAERDSTALLPLGDLLIEAGDSRSGALDLARLYQSSTGTWLGALAAVRLEALLGQRLPLSEEALAMRAEVEQVAATWTRYATEASLVTSMRMRPESRTVGLFDPLVVDIEVFNHLGVPLGITPMGPIKDLVVLEASVQQPWGKVPPGQPMVVDIARRLYLQPHQRLRVPVDLREYWVGDAVDRALLYGASVDVEGVLNPRVATAPASGQGVPVPGPLGMIASTGFIHVQGTKVTPVDVPDMIERMLASDDDETIKDMAVLGKLLADTMGTDRRPPLDVDQRQQVEAALSEKWPRLTVNQQAWLVSVTPLSAELGDYLELINATSEPLVQQVLLMRVALEIPPDQALDDPRLIAALRSTDQNVYDMATFLEYFLTMSAKQRLQVQQAAP